MKEKRTLIRVVKNSEGQVFVDPSGKQNGRGAYVCRDPACYAKVRKTKALNREFSADITDLVYDNVAAQLEANDRK